MRRSRAFVLIEIIVALTILALLAAIAIPVYSTVQQQATDKSYWAQAGTLTQAASSSYAVNGCYPADAAANTMPANLGPYVGGPWPSGYHYHAWSSATGGSVGSGSTAAYIGVTATNLPGGDVPPNTVWIVQGQSVPTC